MEHAVYDANNNIIRPIVQLQMKNNNHLAAMIRDDAGISFSVEDQHLLLHYVDHTIPDLSDIASEFGLIESSRTVETKAELYDIFTQRAKQGGDIKIGNVDLFDGETGKFKAPVLDSAIESAGFEEGQQTWTINEWPTSFGYKSTFPQLYTYNGKWAVATPIKQDGTILSKTSFNEFTRTCLGMSEPMEYDDGLGGLIFYGVTEDKRKAEILAKLIEELEDAILTSCIPEKGEGKKYYDDIIEAGMENQTEDLETICALAGITDENVVHVVNTIYPYFNCQPEDTDSAWGRLRKLLFYELWIIVPRRE